MQNLRLSVLEQKLTPPGISVLLGGTPKEAANQVREAFPNFRQTVYLVTAEEQQIGQIVIERTEEDLFFLPDDSQHIAVDDVQIWSDGTISFKVDSSALSSGGASPTVRVAAD